MEAANQKKKFVCSYCNKRYPCGKSLGGHIRIHLKDSSSYGNEAQAAAGDGYILRENPKKTKKFDVDPNKNNHHGLLKVCKECGKGFQSLKALCGHMACHSRNYSSYDSDEEEDLLMDDDDDRLSDTETSTPSKKRRRSKRMVRYKNIGLYGNGSGGSLSSSIASDLEQEQEEVALCLMMLSKDSGTLKGCFRSYVAAAAAAAAADSYDDNNSVVLEAKMRIKMKNSIYSSSCYDDGDGDDDDDGDKDDNFMEMKVARKKKQHQQRQVVMSSDGYDSGNSDSSGYFNYGPKKSELSDVSTDEVVVKKVEIDSGFGDSAFNDDKGKKRMSCLMRKEAKDDSFIGGQQQRRIIQEHQKKKARDVTYESGENSFEAEPTTIPSKKKMVVKSWNNNGRKNPPPAAKGNAALSKKAKTHECPFCNKVFKSGQALGGHKRSHFVRASDHDGNATLVIKSSAAGMIDLNLPAPEEQGNANGFVTW